VPLVEFVGAVQVLLVEEEGVLAVEDPRARVLPDVVADGVADDGRDREDDPHHVHVEPELRLRGQEAGGDEQGVAREEEPHQEPGLGEDDQRQSDVPGGLDEGARVAQEVKELEQLIHDVPDEAR
jgi:hypothetical protein